MRKDRLLVLLDEDKLDVVLAALNYPWVRFVRMSHEREFPLPPGTRLVSDAAWEVLRLGAAIPTRQLEESLAALGTNLLADEDRTDSERWTVAELERRRLGKEEFGR